MKPTVLIATFTAIAGFAAGWLFKPSEAPATAGPQPSAASGRQSGTLDGKSRDRSAERPLILKPRGDGRADSDPETAEMHVKFDRTLKSSTQSAEKARLDRLVEALGLSPEQKEAMEALLAGRRDGFRELQGNGKSRTEMVEEAANAQRVFEQEVAKILDPEQVTALADLNKRNTENNIEVRAYRSLQDVIGQVDLSPEQRDQALEIFRASSAEAQKRRPEGWSIMNETLNVMGGSQVSALDDMSEFLTDPAVMNDPLEIQRRVAQKKRMDGEQMVSQLTSILTPAQLRQYKATVDARASFAEQVLPAAPKKR
jgi:hypothetical protein